MPLKPTLGLLGFGAFARFMARHLAPRFALRAHDRVFPDQKALDNDPDARQTARDADVDITSLEDAARADVVVLAVTMDGFADVAGRAAVHVRPDALVVDVASVKLAPARIMRASFPGSVDLLGLHPMFGPQSGAGGIAGMPCAVCPLRVGHERLARARAYLENDLGLRLIDTDPDTHDREMARVQALTHFISRGLREAALGPSPFATRAYEQLEKFANTLLSDSWELFLTIERDNPYAERIRRDFLSSLDALEARIASAPSSPSPSPAAAATERPA